MRENSGPEIPPPPGNHRRGRRQEDKIWWTFLALLVCLGPPIGASYFFLEDPLIHSLAAFLIVVSGGLISIIAWQGWKGLITIALLWFGDDWIESVKPDHADTKRIRIIFTMPLTAFLLGLPITGLEVLLQMAFQITEKTSQGPAEFGFLALWGMHLLTGLWAGAAMHWFAKEDLLLDGRKFTRQKP